MYNRPSVTPTPRRAINVPAAAEGATLAASALGTAAEAFQKERERAGRIRADAAEAEIRGIGARLGDEVSRMQRTQAFGAETMVAERWDTETAKVLSEIADPEVRSAVQRRSDILRGEIVEQARRHGLNQQEVVRKESFLTNMQSNIATLASTPLAQAESILVRMDEAARANARAEGRDEAGIEREAQRIRATGRYAQITALVSNDAPDEALAYLERDDVKKEMQSVIESDGRTLYDKARKLVEGEAMESRAQAGRDAIVAEYETEAEALAAVKERYSGALEQRVRQYVVQDFADRDRRKREAVSANTNAALRGIIDGRGIPAEARRFLYENDPKTLDELTRYQTSRAQGRQPETVWAVFEELLKLHEESPTQFANVDLAKYRNQLSDRHYEELVRYKVGQRGRREAISPLAINRFVWSEAQRSGVIPPERASTADLKGRADESERYARLETAMKSALDAALAANPRLTAAEQMSVMRQVVDDQVIVQSSRWYLPSSAESRDTIPRAAVLPGERVVGGGATLNGRKPMATRVNELRGQGMSKDAIERQMRSEGYGPEMDAVTP